LSISFRHFFWFSKQLKKKSDKLSTNEMQRVRNVSRPNAATKAAMEGLEPPRAAVLAESEVQRMYNIVENQAAQRTLDEAHRREQLKALSEQRVAHWPNTIEAQRLKKEQLKRQRLEEEEERRRAIDEQEQALQEAKKEQAIRKANILLFEENDRIKTFGSKLFLATVLDERQKQLAMKEEQKLLAKQSEERWALLGAEQRRRAEDEERAKLRAIDERAMSLKEGQLSQLEDIRRRKIKERDDNVAEGQLIRLRAELALEEEKEAELRRIDGQRQRTRELVVANAEQKTVAERRAQAERDEEARILEYARQKELQLAERNRKLDEKEAGKRAMRQQLIESQAERLASINAAREAVELKMTRDVDAQRAAREAQEQAKRDARAVEITEYRERQRRLDAQKAAQAEADKTRMSETWKRHATRAVEEELAEKRELAQRAQYNQQILLLQAHEKRQQAVLHKQRDYEEGVAMQRALEEEQELVEDYVNAVAHEYVTRGRDSAVVQLAARSAKRTLGTSKAAK
jgi:hypothetical protein